MRPPGRPRAGIGWLHGNPALFEVAQAKQALQNDFGLGVEILTPAEVAERFPVLDGDPSRWVGATFSPRDGLVNPNAVRQWFQREGQTLGVLNRHYVSGISTARQPKSQRRVQWVEVTEIAGRDPIDREGSIRDILTTHVVPPDVAQSRERIDCDLVVNCLGAWSPLFSAKVGISDVTEPTRRQICMLSVQHEDSQRVRELLSLGMVVDASGLYCHPEGNDILAGYSIPEEAPGFDFDYDGERFFMEHIWPRLTECSSLFERSKHVRGWSGLYAVTPDRSGIAGPVTGFTNLFEAHSFTGRGVMQSYGIATELAAFIEGGQPSGPLASMSRDRFADRSKWLVEDLHI